MPVMSNTLLVCLLALFTLSACTPSAGILGPPLRRRPPCAAHPLMAAPSLPGGTLTVPARAGHGVNLNITACKGFKPGGPLNPWPRTPPTKT